MLLKSLTAAMFAVLVALSPAQADRAVECVQNQLTALGYNLGKPDGMEGPSTRAAFNKFQKDRGDAAFEFRLQDGHYLVLCRQLGLETPKLQAFWPAKIKPFTLSYDGTIVREIRDLTQANVEAVERFYAKHLDLKFVEQVEFVVGSNTGILGALLKAKLEGRFDAEKYSKSQAIHCRDDVLAGAFTFQHVVVVCLSPDLMAVSAELDQRLHHLAAREMFRAVQNQLTAAITRKNSKNPMARQGPEWLLDGSARYLALRASDPTLDAVAVVQASNGGAVQVGYLAQMEMATSDPETRPQDWDACIHAVAELVKLSGDRALVAFYQRLGIGQSWQDAFAASFGISAADFYARFDPA